MQAEERDKSAHHPEYTKVVDLYDFSVGLKGQHFELTGGTNTGVVDEGTTISDNQRLLMCFGEIYLKITPHTRSHIISHQL
jgi:hypothetical protein